MGPLRIAEAFFCLSSCFLFEFLKRLRLIAVHLTLIIVAFSSSSVQDVFWIVKCSCHVYTNVCVVASFKLIDKLSVCFSLWFFFFFSFVLFWVVVVVVRTGNERRFANNSLEISAMRPVFTLKPIFLGDFSKKII